MTLPAAATAILDRLVPLAERLGAKPDAEVAVDGPDFVFRIMGGGRTVERRIPARRYTSKRVNNELRRVRAPHPRRRALRAPHPPHLPRVQRPGDPLGPMRAPRPRGRPRGLRPRPGRRR